MFNNRSYKKEMLDEPDIDKALLYQNLKELEIINKYLGGHAVSLKGINAVVNTSPSLPLIADIGCGGGDSIKAISGWLQKQNLNTRIIGIDLKQDCIDYSRNNCATLPNVEFQCNDFNAIFNSTNQPAIIHASLFFHHFPEENIISFFKNCNEHKVIAVINDLERNSIAYYSIKLLTKLFSKSPLVKNDAPLSVLRGFKKKEWELMINTAGIKRYSVTNCWAFRHLIIAYPNG